jgi:FMN-dependent NADH-azoreductase
MPALDGDVIEAKYAVMHNKPQTQEQARAWKQVEDIITEFKNADKYVISLPMWNFSIPYPLKHYIDLLVQPGYTFTYSPEAGYKGLVTGKKLLLICARGGSYGQGSGAVQLDLQTRYMETIFEFIGFQNIQKLIIEPTLSGEEKKQEVLAQAKAEALKLASQF